MNIDGYQEWIRLVADFTVNSLESWQWAKGSVFYLLGLWSRLVSSMPYLKGESPSLLESYVPKIMKSYITSRFVFLFVIALRFCFEGLQASSEAFEALGQWTMKCASHTAARSPTYLENRFIVWALSLALLELPPFGLLAD